MNLRQDEKGMVLLLVLVIVALLASLLTEFAFSTLVDMRLTETFRDSTRAWYLAKGGIQAGRTILEMDKNGYDHPAEIWGQGVPAFPVGENGIVSVDIEDLESRLNINGIAAKGGNPDLKGALIELFRSIQQNNPDVFPDTPEDMYSALSDWIDADDKEEQQPGRGAERSYYESLPKPYQPNNAPFDFIDELWLVKGFTNPKAKSLLSPFLTAYQQTGTIKINLNTAPVQVLMSLDPNIGTSEAEQFEEARKEPLEDSKDLARFPAISTLTGKQWVKGVFKSDHFLVEASARFGDNGGMRTATAVVNRQQQKTNVYYLKVD